MNQIDGQIEFLALSNELILEKIFHALNITDLLACRLVCRKWGEFGSAVLKHKHSLIPINIVGYYEEKTKHRIHDFLKLKESSLISSLKEFFPYDKFHLGEYGLDLGVPYVNKFFELLSITKLRLSSETLNATQVSTFREILTFHIPKVVHLELDFPRYGYMEFPWLFPEKIWTLVNPPLPQINYLVLRLPEDRTEYVPQFMTDLFRAMPNIETLHLFGVHDKFLEFFLNKILDIAHFPLKKLKNLSISWGKDHSGEITQLHLDKLSEIIKQYLKLKCINFSSITDNIQLRNQQDFFKSASCSLEKIKISKFSYFSAAMPLNNSKVKYFETEQLSELISLDFLYESLPFLQTLILGKVTSGLFGLKCLVPNLIESQPHPLRKLSLPVGLVDSEALPKIISGFSNLCRLELTADDKSLQSIYESIPNIQELVLFNDSTITDEGITGIPQYMCRQLYKDQCEMSGDTTIEELRQNSTQWIGALQRLRLFHMTESVENGPPKNKVSNISVVFGFRFLKELKNLALPNTWITNFSLYYIGKHYNLISVDLSYCFWLTPPGLENLKEICPHLQIRVSNWYSNLVSKYSRQKNMCVPSEYYFMTF